MVKRYMSIYTYLTGYPGRQAAQGRNARGGNSETQSIAYATEAAYFGSGAGKATQSTGETAQAESTTRTCFATLAFPATVLGQTALGVFACTSTYASVYSDATFPSGASIRSILFLFDLDFGIFAVHFSNELLTIHCFNELWDRIFIVLCLLFVVEVRCGLPIYVIERFTLFRGVSDPSAVDPAAKVREPMSVVCF